MSARSDYRARVRDMVVELRARAAERAPEAAVCADEGIRVFAEADTAVMRIYDEISYWGVSALDVMNELDRITSPAIRVEMNSPGGDVFDGIAIYNALRSHPATITVRVDGLAASIASVITQAADERIMQPSAQMMIHNARGLTIGDRHEHADMADLLEQQDAIIAGIYSARSGRDDDYRALMDAETWLTGQGAVDLGLADVALTATAPANRAPATTTTAATPPVVVQQPPAPPIAAGPDLQLHLAANANRRRR